MSLPLHTCWPKKKQFSCSWQQQRQLALHTSVYSQGIFFKHRYSLGVILAIHLYIFPTITCCLVFRQCHNVYLGSDWHEFVGVALCINGEKSLLGKGLWGTHCTRQSVLQSRRLLLHFSQVITSKQANK